MATEIFFEAPAALAAEHLELYVLLRDLYGVDPAAWGARRIAPSTSPHRSRRRRAR